MAQALGAPVLQPTSLKEPPLDVLRRWGPVDLGLVVAYGHLIPRDVFRWPRLGLVNVHFSFLPNLRGAAPVQWCLIRGARETGVSLFQIEEGLDTGPVFLQAREKVLEADTSATLRARLIERALPLVDELLAGLLSGSLKAQSQAGEPTWAPALKKADGRLRWASQSPQDMVNLIRGTYEWPGAFCQWQGRALKIRAAEARQWTKGEPGQVVSVEKGRGFLVKCAKDALFVARVQPEGKKEMSAADFMNGARLSVGEMFS